jgi:tetratricopeptide (TPR) repeat protein
MKKILAIYLLVFLVLTTGVTRAVSLANNGLKGKYTRSLDDMLDLPAEQIDIGTALLIISEQWSDFVYGRQYVRRLDEWAIEAAEEIEEKNMYNSPRAINIVNKFLFEQKGFKPVKDANNPADLLLHSVMDSRQGYCLSLSALYLSLTERIGLPVHGVVVPGHFFVRYDNGAKQYNIETTSGGAITSDEHYIEKFDVPKGKTLYMKNLDKKQVLGCFFNNLGNSYRCIEDYESAMLALRRAVNINPGLAESRINIANLFLQKGLSNRALEQYQHAAGLNPKSAQTFIGIANVFMQQDKLKQAVKNYEKAIALDPNSKDAYKSLAIAYNRTEQFSKAKSLLNRALVWYPEDAELYIQLGDTYRMGGDCYEAILQYSKALEIQLTGRAYFGAGKCYQQSGDSEAAMQAYRKAISVKPDMVNAITSLAGMYFERQDFARAEKLYKDALQFYPDESSIYYNLAACYSNQKKYKLAESAYKKAVTISPESAGAHNGLAITYYYLKDYKEALKHILIAQKLGYDIPQDLLELLERKVDR